VRRRLSRPQDHHPGGFAGLAGIAAGLPSRPVPGIVPACDTNSPTAPMMPTSPAAFPRRSRLGR
jgi:hypothetical protein